MIHNNSSDPVLIKKISLKIWSLRDEIETRIQEKLDAGELVPEALEAKISELTNEYTKKTTLPNNVLQLKSTEELGSEGEDEMAKAMAEAMESDSSDEEEKKEADSAKENEINISVESSKASAVEINPNIITIGIEAPTQLPSEKIFKGKTILSEISMDKMFFFSNKAFTEGQSVVIQFCIPKTFIINADVIYCRPFNIKSRIISSNNYTHRMLIKFNFLKEGERALLRQFILSIEPEIQKSTKKESNQDNDSGESDFNELDDLGL